MGPGREPLNILFNNKKLVQVKNRFFQICSLEHCYNTEKLKIN